MSIHTDITFLKSFAKLTTAPQNTASWRRGTVTRRAGVHNNITRFQQRRLQETSKIE